MLKLKIVTPEGIIFESDKVSGVTLPTQSSVITVLGDHEPLISLLKAGEIEITTKDGVVDELAVSTGLVEIREGSEVRILADTAERAEAIDIAKAEAAKTSAEEYLKQKMESMADVDYAKLQAVIERETARIHVGNKYRKLNKIIQR